MKIFLILCCACLFGCNSGTAPDISQAEHDFFPVNSFLKGQVKQVDSLQLPVRKYTTLQNRSDSVLISQEEFEQLASEFMEPDINDPSISRFYKETSFADQSVPSVTFTYATQEKNLPIQRIDVIVNPDPVLNDQVKSVYIEKFSHSGDTFFVKKLFWKTNRYFQIISSQQVKGGPAAFSQLKVSWTATD